MGPILCMVVFLLAMFIYSAILGYLAWFIPEQLISLVNKYSLVKPLIGTDQMRIWGTRIGSIIVLAITGSFLMILLVGSLGGVDSLLRR